MASALEAVAVAEAELAEEERVKLSKEQPSSDDTSADESDATSPIQGGDGSGNHAASLGVTANAAAMLSNADGGVLHWLSGNWISPRQDQGEDGAVVAQASAAPASPPTAMAYPSLQQQALNLAYALELSSRGLSGRAYGGADAAAASSAADVSVTAGLYQHGGSRLLTNTGMQLPQINANDQDMAVAGHAHGAQPPTLGVKPENDVTEVAAAAMAAVSGPGGGPPVGFPRLYAAFSGQTRVPLPNPSSGLQLPSAAACNSAAAEAAAAPGTLLSPPATSSFDALPPPNICCEGLHINPAANKWNVQLPAVMGRSLFGHLIPQSSEGANSSTVALWLEVDGIRAADKLAVTIKYHYKTGRGHRFVMGGVSGSLRQLSRPCISAIYAWHPNTLLMQVRTGDNGVPLPPKEALPLPRGPPVEGAAGVQAAAVQAAAVQAAAEQPLQHAVSRQPLQSLQPPNPDPQPSLQAAVAAAAVAAAANKALEVGEEEASEFLQFLDALKGGQEEAQQMPAGIPGTTSRPQPVHATAAAVAPAGQLPLQPQQQNVHVHQQPSQGQRPDALSAPIPNTDRPQSDNMSSQPAGASLSAAALFKPQLQAQAQGHAEAETTNRWKITTGNQ